MNFLEKVPLVIWLHHLVFSATFWNCCAIAIIIQKWSLLYCFSLRIICDVTEITLRSNLFCDWWLLTGMRLLYSEIHKWMKKWCINILNVRSMWQSQRFASFLCKPLKEQNHSFCAGDSQLNYRELQKSEMSLRFTIGNCKEYHRKNNI